MERPSLSGGFKIRQEAADLNLDTESGGTEKANYHIYSALALRLLEPYRNN